MNYCLAHSSVGFYQVSKLFCIPVTLLLETIFDLRQQDTTLILVVSLSLILVGMYFVVTEEIRFSTAGILWASLGIISTSATQCFFAPLKKGLGLDSLQLLFHTSPWLTFGSFISVPLFENTNRLLAYELDYTVVCSIFLTCLIAVAFNASNYLVLSLISPLSYNIIGHLKTVTVITAGAYIFGSVPSSKMILGMVLAMSGVLVYSTETCRTQQPQQQVLHSNKPEVIKGSIDKI